MTMTLNEAAKSCRKAKGTVLERFCKTRNHGIFIGVCL